MQRCLGCVLFVVAAGLVQAGDPSSLRYVEFRDGSVLRLPLVDEEWRITIVKPNGTIEDARVRSTSLQSLTLTSEPGFEKKRALLVAVQQLGSEYFSERERAYAELIELGPGIRADLETCLQFATDLETRGRLKRILECFAQSAAPAARSPRIFDVFTIKEPSWGHLGDEGIAVIIDGKKQRIARKDIHAMSMTAPPGLVIPGLTSATSDIRRLGPGEFPAGCQQEAFETTPEGRPLRIGENIDKVFVGKGFTLSTSAVRSFVSVNDFPVGKSRGLSAATHNPLWEGEITIRFCQPGREDLPAGVTHFGCYIANVMRKGTAMTAYDVQGRQLGTIYTQIDGVDFLGIASPVPIHRIHFVPNLQLDRDYTLDDFIFSPPVTHEAVHPEKFLVQLAAGDRVLCDDVLFDKGNVRILGMPGGLPERTLPTEELLRVNFPEKVRSGENHRPEAAGLSAGLFAELRDGSILFAKESTDQKNRPVFARKPNLFQETNHLIGLWSSEYPRILPPAKNNRTLIWNNEHRRWDDISDVRFLDASVSCRRQDQEQSFSYRKLSPLWLATPAEQPAPGTWRVRTRQGEELLLTDPGSFAGRLSQGLNATWQGRALRMLPGELTAIVHVPK